MNIFLSFQSEASLQDGVLSRNFAVRDREDMASRQECLLRHGGAGVDRVLTLGFSEVLLSRHFSNWRDLLRHLLEMDDGKEEEADAFELFAVPYFGSRLYFSLL